MLQGLYIMQQLNSTGILSWHFSCSGKCLPSHWMAMLLCASAARGFTCLIIFTCTARSLPTITASGPWMNRIKKNLQVGWFSSNIVLFILYIILNTVLTTMSHSSDVSVCVCVNRSGGGLPVPWGKSSPQCLPGLQCLYLCLWTNW